MTSSAKSGRPTIYSDELADLIIERICEGESLREICRSEGMPARATVFRWLADDSKKTFRDQYALACDQRADYLFDEIVEIADDGSNDWMLSNRGDNPGWVTNGEALQRSRLRVDTRKWIASKLQPRKYGDKVGIEHSGALAITHEQALALLDSPDDDAPGDNATA